MNEMLCMKLHQALFLTLVMIALSIRILTITNAFDLLNAFIIDTMSLFCIICAFTLMFNRKSNLKDRKTYRSRYLRTLRRPTI
ncbi:MAG: hypothetical protein K2X93_28025 [Candidatus Obscuribacterales bacterium]|nr:hypothetical protein [Candidatus Obscuribacterales bacterium]